MTAPALDRAAATWTALGVEVRLVVTDPRRLAAAKAILKAELAELDMACSRFRFDSELMSLDRAQGRPTRVSPLLAEALAVALRAAEETGGDVDPTVGNALIAAGYDRDFALLAGDGSVLTIERGATWKDITLAGDLVTVPAGVRLDLGATAKAWAADRSAALLAHGLDCGVLVGLGGDIAVAGPAPQGGWQVRVRDMTDHETDGPAATVTLRRGGLATSSTTARRWQRGGEPMHHILDPRSGLPATEVWRTVSVAADSCVRANTASTAAVIRGERAPAALTLPARLVRANGQVTTLNGWPR